MDMKITTPFALESTENGRGPLEKHRELQSHARSRIFCSLGSSHPEEMREFNKKRVLLKKNHTHQNLREDVFIVVRLEKVNQKISGNTADIPLVPSHKDRGAIY